jgi:hypothetical protein
MLRTTPEFIDRQPKGHFAVAVRNLTSTAVSLRIPFGYLEDMPHLSDEEMATLRDRMRERYAVYWKEIVPTAPGAPIPIDPDAVDTSAASW